MRGLADTRASMTFRCFRRKTAATSAPAAASPSEARRAPPRRRSVTPNNAETVTTNGPRCGRIRPTTRRIAAASATDAPPNFQTCRGVVRAAFTKKHPQETKTPEVAPGGFAGSRSLSPTSARPPGLRSSSASTRMTSGRPWSAEFESRSSSSWEQHRVRREPRQAPGPIMTRKGGSAAADEAREAQADLAFRAAQRDADLLRWAGRTAGFVQLLEGPDLDLGVDRVAAGAVSDRDRDERFVHRSSIPRSTWRTCSRTFSSRRLPHRAVLPWGTGRRNDDEPVRGQEDEHDLRALAKRHPPDLLPGKEPGLGPAPRHGRGRGGCSP